MPWTIGRPGSPNPKVLQRLLREACAYCTSELGALQKGFGTLEKRCCGGEEAAGTTPFRSFLSLRSLENLCEDSGALVIGKTNMDCAATGLVGVRSPYGACQNAFAPPSAFH